MSRHSGAMTKMIPWWHYAEFAIETTKTPNFTVPYMPHHPEHACTTIPGDITGCFDVASWVLRATMSIPIMNMAVVSLHVSESHNLSQNILQLYSIRSQPLNVSEGITSGACHYIPSYTTTLNAVNCSESLTDALIIVGGFQIIVYIYIYA